VATINPVLLDAGSPTLKVETTLAAPGSIRLTLLNSKRKTVAHWAEPVHSGSLKLSLRLPATARRPGRYLLRFTFMLHGQPQAKSYPVTLRA
jgi:hypothetical protein